MENKTNKFATKTDFATTRVEIESLKAYIARSKAEIIKWMFIFWVAQVVTTFGFIALYLEK